ncbi:Radical SAM domain protein [Candidatus Sulfotelmatobacter kueseliae]|uniref:Radical SAM domain protein n=1 Tax=Candidatus Sulfotelmatobacter kueseliae TaxID=2042962 RepID=A0A2U3LCW7_9BACT|nr:Radical SAM domain protein [Candidatus Sulfotelmatobacter kueseliae]
MSLLAEMNHKALKLGVPLSVHLDITYRCNERCVHCYLDHDDHGELSTAEIKDVLNQLSEAGVFFLMLSGGEVLMRRDFFEILEFSRRLLFNVKLKTNAGMIREPEARRIRELAVAEVQISVYSHRAAVHDAITKLPGSWKRTTDAIRFLRSQGLKVTIANVLMSANWYDYSGVVALAHELGVTYTVDPTITPKIDGDSSIVKLRIEGSELNQLFHDPNLVGDVQEFCAPPPPPGEDVMEGYPCSAGHTSCYISPYGDVFPCVQFPLPSGNVRKQRFLDIWQDSAQLRQVRSIRAKDLPTCSSCAHVGTCTRCPGLAYMEGNMLGPSTADCQKSFQRTGVPTANMLRGLPVPAVTPLVQIQPMWGTSAEARQLGNFS